MGRITALVLRRRMLLRLAAVAGFAVTAWVLLLHSGPGNEAEAATGGSAAQQAGAVQQSDAQATGLSVAGLLRAAVPASRTDVVSGEVSGAIDTAGRVTRLLPRHDALLGGLRPQALTGQGTLGGLTRPVAHVAGGAHTAVPASVNAASKAGRATPVSAVRTVQAGERPERATTVADRLGPAAPMPHAGGGHRHDGHRQPQAPEVPGALNGHGQEQGGSSRTLSGGGSGGFGPALAGDDRLPGAPVFAPVVPTAPRTPFASISVADRPFSPD